MSRNFSPGCSERVLALVAHNTGSVSNDFVLSPGINCLHPDVVVHALFHRLKGLAREAKQDRVAYAGSFRRLHRRV
jgi:hypothetical protein